MAAASGEEGKLRIIEVTYGGGKVPNVQEIFRRDLPTTEWNCLGFSSEISLGIL